MSNFASSKPVILKNVRLQWADLFKPGEGMNGGAPKFKVVALFQKDSEAYKVATSALLEAARGLWGDNAANVVRGIPANSKAVRDGNSKMNDKGEVREEFEDMYFISAANKQKPQVIAQKRHNNEFVTIDESGAALVRGMDVTSELGYPITVPYRGCYVNLKVTMVAGKSLKAGDGQIIPNQVYAKLEAVQFLRDGEAFGSGPTSAEGFDDEDVEASADAEEMF